MAGIVEWDNFIPGFGQKYYDSGKKSWILEIRHNGKRRMVTLGRCSIMHRAEAIEKARITLLEARYGIVRDRTLDEVFTEYSAMVDRIHNKSWAKNKKRYQGKISFSLGNSKLKDINPALLLKYHASMAADTPYEANRCVELISSVFNYAIKMDYAIKNPAKGFRYARERTRDRFLTPSERTRLFEAVKSTPAQHTRMAFLFLMLTGLRKSEVLSLLWKDTDLELCQTIVRDTKNGNDFVCPLPEFLVGELRHHPKHSHHIIAGNVGGRRTRLERAWNKLKRQARIDNVRIHDLRRTYATSLLANGAQLPQIKDALNHKSITSTLTYARYAPEVARELTNRHYRLLAGPK